MSMSNIATRVDNRRSASSGEVLFCEGDRRFLPRITRIFTDFPERIDESR